MYNVVIGVDDEEAHAIACAEPVADLPGDDSEITVTLVHTDTGITSEEDEHPESVQRAAEFFESRGIECRVTKSTDDPAEAIITAGEAVDANLIVVGGRRRSPAGKALFGSVTQTVVLSANQPVLVVNYEEQPQ